MKTIIKFKKIMALTIAFIMIIGTTVNINAGLIVKAAQENASSSDIIDNNECTNSEDLIGEEGSAIEWSTSTSGPWKEVDTIKQAIDQIAIGTNGYIRINHEEINHAEEIIIPEGKNITLYSNSEKNVIITRDESFIKTMFKVQEGGKLTLGNNEEKSTLTIDGGKDKSIQSTGSIVINEGILTINKEVTLQNNNNENNGGSIYNNGINANLTMNGGKITKNNAFKGSGVFNDSGIITISEGEISENTSISSGGGLYNMDGTLKIKDNAKVNNNKATQNGGGVYNEGKFEMNTCKIMYNEATNGGGVYNSKIDTEFTIVDGSNIENNTATNNGGGIYNNANALFEMDGGKIINNKANNGNGGGMYNSGTFITNSGKISNNEASKGGGLYINSGLFNISGDVSINPVKPGVNEKNDIYLKTGNSIKITDELTDYSQKFIITPENTEEGTKVVETGGHLIAEDLDKFNLNKTIRSKELVLNETNNTIEIKGITSSVAEYSVDGGNTWIGTNSLYDAFEKAQLESSESKVRLIENETEVVEKTIDVNAGKTVTFIGKDNNTVTRYGDFGYMFNVKASAKLILGESDAANKLTIDGGKDNSIKSTGAIIYNQGTVLMNDGVTLQNNTSINKGGGVFNAGTFTMDGGLIKNNESEICGGGVYNTTASAIFTMNSGIIESDKYDKIGTGNGVYIWEGKFNLQGNALINENSDIYLKTDSFITIKDKLTNYSQKFIITPENTTEGTKVVDTGGHLTTQDLNKFDLSVVIGGKELILNETNNTIEIKEITSPVAQYSTDDGSTWTGTKSLYDAFEKAQLESSESKVRLIKDENAVEKTININSNKKVTFTSKDNNTFTRYEDVGYMFNVKVSAQLILGESDAANKLTIDGGKDNSIKSTGAIIYNQGTVLMNDGVTLQNNTSINKGGGVFNAGKFTMDGGLIKNNESEICGGGVYNTTASAIFTMNDGIIESDKNDKIGTGNGVYIWEGKFNLQGNALINENSDICLNENQVITIAGELTNSDQHFIITPENSKKGTKVAETGGYLTEQDLDKFSLNETFNNKYLVLNEIDNAIEIGEEEVPPVAQYSIDDGNTWIGTDSLESAFEKAQLESSESKVRLVENEVEIEKIININADKTVTFINENNDIDKHYGDFGYMFNVKASAQLILGESAATGTLTIDGGKDNSIKSTGAIIYNQGTVLMNDGVTLQNNKSMNIGGGVYNAGIFTMDGGLIKNNESEVDGGGVYNGTDATFTMKSGTIENNKCNRNGNGVYISQGKFNLQGNSLINENNDIYLNENQVITITGELTNSDQHFTITPKISYRGTKVAEPYEYTIKPEDLNKFNLNESIVNRKLVLNETNNTIEIKEIILPIAEYSIDDGKTWTEENSLESAFEKAQLGSSESKVRLVENETEIQKTIDINDNKTVTLEIGENEHKITRGEGISKGNIINVKSGATIKLGETGSTGTLIIDGGKEKSFDAAGSIINNNLGNVIINDGIILQNNNCSSNGGAIINKSGTVEMNGGYIRNNMSKARGGALYNTNNNATFTMNGGTIEGNQSNSNGSGICILQGEFNLQGDALINKNNDIYLGSQIVITITEKLTNDNQHFAITPAKGDIGTKVAETGGYLSSQDVENKFSLNANYKNVKLALDESDNSIKIVAEDTQQPVNENITDTSEVNTRPEIETPVLKKEQEVELDIIK